MSDTPRTDALKVDLSRDTFAVFIEMREHARQLERDLAAANAELGALKREVLALGTGLIRVRQQIFPAHDQTAVIRRDFPIYAAIAARKGHKP